MKKNLIIIVVVVILIIVGIVLYKKWKSNKDAAASADDPLAVKPSAGTYTAPAASSYSSLPTGTFPIKQGSKNKLVYLLQTALNKLHGSGLTVDGDFGYNTKTALKSAYGVEQVDVVLAKKIYLAMYAKKATDASLEGIVTSMEALFV